MTEQQPPSSLFEQLHSAVRRRPRWYFVARVALLTVGLAALTVIAAFATGAVIFLWRERELGAYAGFGPQGRTILVQHFPWLSALAAVVVAGLFIVVVRRATAWYRLPLATVMGIALIGAGILGLASTRMPYHGSLANRSINGPLPLFGHEFEPFIDEDSVLVGFVQVVASDHCVIVNDRGRVTVRIDKETRAPRRYVMRVGERVIVLGRKEDGAFIAEQIRPARMRIPPPRFFDE